ncbi:MAG: hypothetical protein AB2693_19385, partial [Candidatus Thiodiazotropha sp.]
METQGVFSISFEDDSGNPLIINDDLDLYGTPEFNLWQFDEVAGNWILVSNNDPGRKRRQVTQQEFLGRFNPQRVNWWNIDRIYSEPDCFFKVRVFDDTFTAANEIMGSIELIPTTSQVLASESIVKYFPSVMKTSDPRCFRIKCPPGIAVARIRFAAFETLFGLSGVRVPLLPASLPEYSTGIRNVLQQTPYFYSLFENDTTTIFVNSPSASSGPFYQTVEDCSAASIGDSAFWFAKEAEFVESNFYEDFEGRCVGKAQIYFDTATDEVGESSGGGILSANLTSLSLWSGSNYALRMAEIYELDSFGYASCFEYRCSMQSENGTDITRVSLGLSSEMGTSYQCFLEGSFEGGLAKRRKRGRDQIGSMLYAPVLDPLELPSGFFYNNMSNVDA